MTTTKQYFKVKNGLEFPRQDALTVTDNGGPSVRPSLLLDFSNSKELDPRLTFSRSSSASYYDGKTSAKSSENLLIDSINMSSSWSPGSASYVTGQNDPFGGTGAIKLVPNGTYGQHYTGQWSVNSFNVMSVYAKAAGSQYMALNQNNGSYSATFDLINGTILEKAGTGTIASIVSVGNGWYRCSVVLTTFSTTFMIWPFHPISTAPWGNYSGDGSFGVLLYGPQAENNTFVSSYVPTNSSPASNNIPVLQSAPADVPRFDHDPVTGESKGLFLEIPKTNKLINSETFIGWDSKSNVIVNNNAAVAPNGLMVASKVMAGLGSSRVQLAHYYTASYNTGPITLSVYAKAGTYGYIKLVPFSISSGTGAIFNLNAGTFTVIDARPTTTATMTPVGDGWYRCSVTTTGSYYYTYFTCILSNYTGGSDGGETGIYKPNPGQYVYLWGAQSEDGGFVSSYIPTTLSYYGRPSTGTYMSSDGVLKTASSGVARYNVQSYEGSNLIVEPSATNLLTMSEKFTSPSWGVFGYIISNAIQSPDGQINGSKICETNTTGQFYPAQVVSTIANTTYTLSVYAKAAERDKLWLYIVSNSSSNPVACYVNFLLSTGTIGNITGATNATMTDVGGGWYRCSFTFTTPTGNTWSTVEIHSIVTQDVYNYQGTAGSGIYLWGAQLEANNQVTSYVPSVDTVTSRASTATYYDNNGVLRTALTNQPRYTYNPGNLFAEPKLLYEVSGTNLMPYSENLSAWSLYAVTAGSLSVAPDGNTTAYKISPTTATNQHYIQQILSHTAGQAYTASCYVKYGGATSVSMYFNTGPFGPASGYIVFSFLTNSISSAANLLYYSSRYVGNGWFRISMTQVATATASGAFYLAPYNLGTYTGTGSDGVYIWGVQMENDHKASSYIPTTSTAVTRAADVFTSTVGTRAADVSSSSQATRAAEVTQMLGTNFSSWYRKDEGTFFTSVLNTGTVATGNVPLSITDGGTGNSIVVGQHVGGTLRIAVVSSGIWSNYSIFSATTVPTVTANIAVAYKQNDFATSLNGALSDTDNSGIVPTVTGLYIGDYSSITQYFNGHIKSIKYYPKRITNTELTSLTS